MRENSRARTSALNRIAAGSAHALDDDGQPQNAMRALSAQVRLDEDRGHGACLVSVRGSAIHACAKIAPHIDSVGCHKRKRSAAGCADWVDLNSRTPWTTAWVTTKPAHSSKWQLLVVKILALTAYE